MSISVRCSECGHRWKVADTAAGKRKRCPECEASVTVPALDDESDAEETAVASKPIAKKTPPKISSSASKSRRKEEEEDDEDDIPPPRKKRRRYEDDEDDDEDDFRSLRRRVAPHRGVSILVLSLVSIVGACLCAIIGWGLGAVVLSMATTDLARMKKGDMDRDGQGLTMAGLVCAIVAVVLGIINAILGVVLQFKK